MTFPELEKLALASTDDLSEQSRSIHASTETTRPVESKKQPLFRSLRNIFIGKNDQPMKESRSSSSIQESPSSKEYLCSEVVADQVYISGWLVAEDWDELSSRGITHVINTASSVSECPFPERICYLPLSIEDSKSEDIQSYFYICIDFIESAISSGGRVLVHCMEGVSRSCSNIIAYLMWKRSMTYEEAQSFVQEARPISQPNTGFICQILDFQKVIASQQSPEGPQLLSWRTWRLQAKKLINGSFVVTASVLSNPVRIDPRFVYIRRQGTTVEVLLPEQHQSPRLKEIVDIVCSQISRIEKQDHMQTVEISGFGIVPYQEPRLDEAHDLFSGFFVFCSVLKAMKIFLSTLMTVAVARGASIGTHNPAEVKSPTNLRR